MTIRSNGPLAGFGWLKRAINLGHGNPKAVFGGAALLIVASLLPSLVTMPVQLGMATDGPPNMKVFGALMLFSMIAGLFLVPLFAGYLRVIDATERGQPIRVRDVFALYREGQTLRLVGYGLAMMAVYVAVIAIVLVVAGGGIATWYMQLLTAQSGGTPPTSLPAGFGLAVFLFGVLGLLVMGVYSISLGQVALGGRSVLGAIGDGLVGSLKNVLPLIVFALSLAVAWLIVVLAAIIVGSILAIASKLVGAWLLVVLAVPLYIAFLLAMFAVMFGVMYHLWRDVCGDATPDAGEALAA
jgi:hypothetical protein